jgi:hypothetical protein
MVNDHKQDRAPVQLRFALIGGPPDFHVNSLEWAKAAFSLADAVLEIERRSNRNAFGFITDVDYRYGRQGPIRSIVWEMTGRWSTRSYHYPQGIPPRHEKMPTGSPKRGRWYLSKDAWRRSRPPVPAVYIYSCERVIPNKFEQVCRILSETASAAGVSPPLVVMPDGGGARLFATGQDSERVRLRVLLPAGFDPGPCLAAPSPSLSTVILETGEQLHPAVFRAALCYLRARHQSSLTVWDILNDPLLRESAMAAQPEDASL